MNKFDSIRPYEDSEVEEVLSSLCSNINVIRALIDSADNTLMSLLPFKEKIISLYLKHKTKNITSIHEYQNLFESIVSKVVSQSIDNLSVSGLENLDKNKTKVLPILKETYSEKDGEMWLQRWRIFFMACAELWGYKKGVEWRVGHYLFQK